MREETIGFYADGIRLHGALHHPETTAPPLVIGVHGLLSNGESPKQLALAERLNRCGIAFFRFDHRGCGGSQGHFSQVTTFEGRCNDLSSAIRIVTSRPDIGGRIGLFGSSMGGAVCLAIAGGYPIDALVTLAAPVRLSSIIIPPDMKTDPAYDGMTPEQMAFDISDRLSQIQDFLIFHGDADQVVPFPSAEELFRKAGDPKELIRLEMADHPLSDPSHQDLFLSKSVDWFRKRLL